MCKYIILVAVLLCGCHTEPYENLLLRYESFYALLDGEVRAEYDAEALGDAALILEARIAGSPDLDRRFEKLQSAEKISFFSVYDVLVYFRRYVYPRIEFYKTGRPYDDLIN